ncbi:hypothetical protein PHMEG_00037351 [Phytophthora megakarya]|uniref:Pectinesterase inhibitor domain-containing protein n=1 Tax=Phytophthora megakarya TaxID=4795 RepID=A0A225UL78_9STRA|nr:hypothetical protein PHMEG_00037351 [Phytophthora megakarya]
MRTPDTVGAINRITTPFINSIVAASRAVERQTTASTARLSYSGSVVICTSEDDSHDEDDDRDLLRTFEACSSAITAAAERMEMLNRQPRSLSVAIAYDECLDIVTAAVDHMERIGSQGLLTENVLQAYRAMRSIRELLRPSPPVRRALQF